jgi:V8-like Glu-specific endopeptidase
MSVTIVDPAAIVQVWCFAKDAIYAGSAFRVGNGLLLSVNHVTNSGQCLIDGKAIDIKYKAPKADFSMLKGDPGPFLKVDCGGYVKGRKYIAAGYARGLNHITLVELAATGETDPDSGQSILMGIFSVVPGQSGGPIFDEETGEVVGVINAENYEEGLSWSVPLSDTPLCGKGTVA